MQDADGGDIFSCSDDDAASDASSLPFDAISLGTTESGSPLAGKRVTLFPGMSSKNSNELNCNVLTKALAKYSIMVLCVSVPGGMDNGWLSDIESLEADA